MTQAFWAIKQSTSESICTVISIRFWEYDWIGGVFLTLIRTRPVSTARQTGDLQGAPGQHATKVKRRPGLPTFRQNVEATIPALRRYARALTRDADIADDLVQDTLVRALRSEHLFHGGDVRSWLYTILTNLNRNRLRSLARRPVLSPIEDNDAPDLAGPEAGGRDIERALATLVEDQRNALLLVVLEGLSYREVAEVQGVPIGTVMSRLARARVQIKTYLDGGRPALRRVK
jgi:RNA polymerase sigma-70 factor, ECF subfamily